VVPAISGVGRHGTSGGGGRAWVLPTGAGAKVGGEPSAAADTGADVAAIDEAGRWSRDGTLSSTLEEHYRTELPQPCFLVGMDHIIRDDDIADKF
jgi:hypothetical protein